MKKRRGQEAIEFVLISILVFFAALFVVVIFGNKIAGFFTSSSSAAKVAQNKVNVISSTAGSKYVADYETKASGEVSYPYSLPPKITESSNETITLTVGDLVIENIPADISKTIQTTGASGGTDAIVDSMSGIIAQLKSMSEQDPDNNTLKQISDLALKMADTGYLVSDAQEWVEYAAIRINSSSAVNLPDDNRICEDGSIKKTSCDQTLSNQYFFTGDLRKAINDHIDQQTNNLLKLNSQLQTLVQTPDLNDSQLQTVQDAAKIIGILTTQIQEISTNLKSANDKNFEELKAKLASQTTDLKSRLIEETGTAVNSKNSDSTNNVDASQ